MNLGLNRHKLERSLAETIIRYRKRRRLRRRNPLNKKMLKHLLDLEILKSKVKELRQGGQSVREIAKNLRLSTKRVKELLGILDSGWLKLAHQMQEDGVSLEDIIDLLKLDEEQAAKLRVKEKSMPIGPHRTAPYAKNIKEQVRDLCRNTNWSYGRIARETGISRITVARWCKNVGLPRKRVIPTVEQKALALKLCAEGLSTRSIAKRVGVSVPTIKRWCGR